jgi:hypothetical protein
MSNSHPLVGLSKGTVDTANHVINFEMTVSDGPPISITGEFGPMAQLIGALARRHLELRRILDQAKGMKTVAAEQVAASHVQKDQWENIVMMQLTTPMGVPYTFALRPEDAAAIAVQLKTESAKPHLTGKA